MYTWRRPLHVQLILMARPWRVYRACRYLHRKDFLERCDLRQFEQEKDARNVKRAKEEAAAAAAARSK
jgi:hypothetical protein